MPSFAAIFARKPIVSQSNAGLTRVRENRCRALVIGSGFGGSIAAYRLSQKGIDTVVLERGRRWITSKDSDVFATTRNLDGRANWLNGTDLFTYAVPPVGERPTEPLDHYVGLVEHLHEDGMYVLAPAAVGGGSLVYNTCLVQPSEENFYACFPREVDYSQMNSEFYPEVLKIMGAGPIPDDILESKYYHGARLMHQLAVTGGVPIHRINTATDWNVIRDEIYGRRRPSAIEGDIWYGANSGYKNSLDKNYLKYAEQSGYVKVQPLSNVLDIAEQDGKYNVTYARIDEYGNELSREKYISDFLFMGAGSMGTTKLLVRAKAKGGLPNLDSSIGQMWGNNGDTFGHFSIESQAGAHEGGPAHFVATDWSDNPMGPQTCIAYPDHTLPEDMIQYLGMSIPSEKGYFDYDKTTDKVTLHWANEDTDRTRERMRHTLEKFARSIQDPERAKRAVESIQVEGGNATAHPCGGVTMGYAADLYGRVKGYKGLYVTDAAFIPLGTAACNPALTTAAFAERSMAEILKNDLI
jgi:cholesterol oxidase